MNQLTAKILNENLDLQYDKGAMRDTLLRLGLSERNWQEKEVLLTVSRFSGKKTREQLGYYFGGIVEFAAKNLHGGGYTKEEAYYLIMEHCSKRPVTNKRTGETCLRAMRLSELDKFRTAQLIDEAIIWLASEGCVVETPEEYNLRNGLSMHKRNGLLIT